MLTLPSTASAHAELSGTTPANESTIEEHPNEVALAFTENVTVPFGAVKAYGPDGSRVNRGESKADGDEVVIPIDADAVGTYAISWRVTSADGHPVRGAFVFHVERESDDTVSRDQALQASEGSRTKDIAFGIARGVMLLAVLVAVGGVVFAALAVGSWQPRWLRGSLLLALVAMVVAYVLDASIASGLPIADVLLDPSMLREQASTVYGGATIVRIVVALVCLAATLVVRSAQWRRADVRYALLVPFLALAATMSLSGHAVGEGVTAVRLPLDMLHSIAAAVWIGGLFQLVGWSRHTPLDPDVVVRYSRLVLGSVAVLVLTGLWASYEEVGLSRDALLDTTYGRLVIVKATLLLATLPLANLNRTRNVPEIRTGTEGAAARLRSYVRVEFWILVLVLAMTAWLIQTPPAKVQLQPQLVDATQQLPGGGSVQLTVDPAAVGSNLIHVYVFDDDLQLDEDVTDFTLTAFNDERGLGPLDIDATAAGPGHFQANRVTIPFEGTWRLEASVRRGRFDEARARFAIRIAPQHDQE